MDNATLTRFFSLHFVTPMAIGFVVVLHIFLLHSTGSNNPLGVRSNTDKVPFHSYFSIKDILGFVVILSFLMVLVFFRPNLLGEPDNYREANPLITPNHIVPE